MAESPRTVINVKKAVVKFADDEAGLTAATEFQCVVTSAAITTSPNLQTIPATGCEGESQIPAASSYSAVFSWLQDWTAPSGGLSGYCWTHDTELKWFSIAPDNPEGDVVATGQAYIVAGPYLGDFGTVLVAAGVTFPCFEKPTITLPAAA